MKTKIILVLFLIQTSIFAQDVWTQKLHQGEQWLSFPIESTQDWEESQMEAYVYSIIENLDQILSVPEWYPNSSPLYQWYYVDNNYYSYNVTIGSAFIFDMDNSDTLIIEGDFIEPANYTFELDTGWNFVGNTRLVDGNITEVLNTLTGFYIVQNDKGNIYCPAYNINSIGNIEAGKAYKIYVEEEQTFTFPTNNSIDSISNAVGCTDPLDQNYNSFATTDNYSCAEYNIPSYYSINFWDYDRFSETIIVNSSLEELNDIGIEIGDVIYVRAHDTEPLGWAKISNESFAISLVPLPLYISDPSFEGVLSFFVWDGENETQIYPNYSLGTPFYEDYTYNIVSGFSLDNPYGCTDSLACNYNPLATYDIGDCDGDTDGDGICDDDEIVGCLTPGSCNYSPNATDISCIYWEVELSYDSLANQISATITAAPISPFDYRWRYNGSSLGSSSALTHTPENNGTYTFVSVYEIYEPWLGQAGNPEYCIREHDIEITSLHIAELENKVKLYPNPSNKYLNVSWENNEIPQLEILNVLGEKMPLQISELSSLSSRIYTEQLNNGIYFLQLTFNSGVQTKQFQVLKK